jgi:hypothetical protein
VFGLQFVNQYVGLSGSEERIIGEKEENTPNSNQTSCDSLAAQWRLDVI